MLTEKELQEIETRENAAAPGPWEWTCIGNLENDAEEIIIIEAVEIDSYAEVVIGEEEKEFTAHARTDVPNLLEMVRELQHEKAELQSQLAESQRREQAAISVIARYAKTLAKAIDSMQPVIHCKDCIKRHTPDCKMWFECGLCYGQYSKETDMDYCSVGARKEANNDLQKTDL